MASGGEPDPPVYAYVPGRIVSEVMFDDEYPGTVSFEGLHIIGRLGKELVACCPIFNHPASLDPRLADAYRDSRGFPPGVARLQVSAVASWEWGNRICVPLEDLRAPSDSEGDWLG